MTDRPAAGQGYDAADPAPSAAKITLTALTAYFDRRHIPYSLVTGWETRGRISGGFDAFYGVVVHHTATPPATPLAETIAYALNGPSNPIANGCITRDRDGPKVVLWAGLAANHAGTGGPRMTTRGLIPADSANRLCFGMEAENSGVGEPWPDDMCDLYVRAVAAILDWANHETPGVPLTAADVFAHREWTSRKVDPAGPSRFADTRGVWDMDAFRSEVAALLKDEDEMNTARLYRDRRYANMWLVGAGAPVHLSPELYVAYEGAGVPTIVDEHDPLLHSLLYQSGMTLHDLIPAVVS